MGLIHPGMLAGILAVAAPIIIHFIRSRKYQRVEIGSLRFLRIAIHERRRWRRIEDWPLLLLRIAALVALAFLFARPFLQAREKVPPRDLEVLILVDVSGSVSGPHFETVRTAARETIAKIPHDAKVTVAEFADDVRIVEDGNLNGLQGIPGAKDGVCPDGKLDARPHCAIRSQVCAGVSDQRFSAGGFADDGAARLAGQCARFAGPGASGWQMECGGFQSGTADAFCEGGGGGGGHRRRVR